MLANASACGRSFMSDNHPSPHTAPAENQLIAERREKLHALRAAQAEGGGVAFPNDFKPSHQAAQLHLAHAAATAPALKPPPGPPCPLGPAPGPRRRRCKPLPSASAWPAA